MSRLLHAVQSSSRALTNARHPLQLILKRSMAATSTASLRVPAPLVSVSWLKEHYPQVKVLDGSFHMPFEKRNARAEFLQQHLPGAHFFDVDECVSREGEHADLPHMLPTADQLSRYLTERGVSRDDCVVIYDAKGVFSSPRVRWTLQHFGVENVAILQGGLKAWIGEGNKVESGEPAPLQLSSTAPLQAQPGIVRSMADVQSNLSSGSFQVVDARSAGRFNGTDPEPRADIPSGHMPGAKNVPFTDMLEPDTGSGTRLRSPEDLAKAFAAAGVDPSSSQPLVASCGSGVTACVVLLGLEVLGRKQNTGLYDGSWTEWAVRKNIIETNKK